MRRITLATGKSGMGTTPISENAVQITPSTKKKPQKSI